MYVDGGPMGNHTRFINHSCEENCIGVSVIVNEIPRIFIKTIEEIDRNEQLFIDYGEKYFTGIKCECNTKSCFQRKRKK